MIKFLGVPFVVAFLLSVTAGCDDANPSTDTGVSADGGIMDVGSFVDAPNGYATPEGEPLPGADCKGAGETCAGNGECCGYPALGGCASSALDGRVCAAFCDVRADCATRCCSSIPGVPHRGVCAPAEGTCLPASPGPDPDSVDTVDGVSGTGCTLPGETCVNNGACCGYGDTNRQSACYNIGGAQACAATCSKGTDCLSGCCVPVVGTPDALCLPYDSHCS